MALRVEARLSVREKTSPPEAATRERDVTSRRTILLVVGEDDQAFYWSAVFSSLGFDLLRATSLTDASTMLAAKPSIVACSSRVSDGSGLKFLSQLRQRPDLALTYLVLLTSSVREEEVIASLRGGANDCIDMTASYGEIRARLELAERVMSLDEALQQKNEALGAALDVIQTELQSAAVLQAAMLPKAFDGPDFQIRTLYKPSDMLGGDMLGLMPVGAELVAFGLIDVVGHGTASALISCSLIREMMDRMVVLLENADLPATHQCGKLVLEELNRRYCRLCIPGMYFTAMAGVLDARRGALSYCQAGHPNLVRFQPGRGWHELQDSGYPIGLFEEADYAQQEIRLRTGEILVAVSDGFMRPRDHDPGGSFELLQALPAIPQSADQVLAALESLAAQACGVERDDQSALLIRYASLHP